MESTLQKKLLKALQDMPNPKKTSDNPFFKSKYAGLPEVDAIITPVLAENGLAYRQGQRLLLEDANITVLETYVLDENEERLLDSRLLTCNGKTQEKGSEETYQRRYALLCAFGLAPEDDDGNAASGNLDHGPEKAAQRRSGMDARASTDGMVSESTKAEMGATCTLYAVAKGMDVDSVKRQAFAEVNKLGGKGAAYRKVIDQMLGEING